MPGSAARGWSWCPASSGCGQILLVAIAIAVSIVTYNLLNPGTTLGVILAGSASAAAGSVVSQGVGVATGIQDKFSFKGVAIAAIAGGIGGALGPGGLFGEGAFSGVTSNKVLEGALRGGTSSVLTQGIAVATGLQDKFSWTGVAVGAVVGGTIGGLEGPLGKAGVGKVGVKVIAGMAGAIAGAATRSLITGTDFGDNIIAALPEVIGNTIGNIVAGEIAQGAQERALRRAGVERSASAFEERFGDTAEVAAYREAGLAAARHPGSREARSNFDQAARILLEANSGDAEVAAFLNHIDPDAGPIQLGDIAVTGSRDYLLGSTIDNAGIWVGEKGNAIKQGVGQFIQDNPGIGIALTLADGAFAVVAPGKYLAGMTLDYFKDEATGFIADKMTGPNLWSIEKGQAGGSGFVLAGGIALGGLGALKGAGGGSSPIWSGTGAKTPVQNAYGHWKKHGSEFPEYYNSKQYVDGARNFVNNPPSGTLTKTRPNGDRLFYDPNTNTFASQAANGAPRTMFRPKAGINYWNKQ